MNVWVWGWWGTWASMLGDWRAGVTSAYKGRTDPSLSGGVEKGFWGCFDTMTSLN